MENELGVEVGQVIADKYRVTRLLGRGGMGSVWQCEHLSLMSKVAVKVIKPDVAKNKNSVARFLREAKAAALLRSPHVVQILDHGLDGDVAFIVMEMLEGESLHARLKRGPLRPAEAATVLTHVGRAPVYLPYVGNELKPTRHYPASILGGYNYHFPRGGECAEGAGLGTDGCTWRRLPAARLLYGCDLLVSGWNRTFVADTPTDQRHTLANVAAFARAARALDALVQPTPCGDAA